MNEQQQHQLHEFNYALVDLVEANASLPAYEIGPRLIAAGVSILLKTAPTPIIAMKTIVAALEIGIDDCEDFS